jgi:putative transposase
MQTVSRSQVVTSLDAVEEPLPARVQEALGQLVGAAKEGLLALSVGVGLGVLEELMAEEVEEVCGPKGRHDQDRVAYRHGSDDGEVTLGGRRVQVERPRMRTKDGSEEVPVRTYEHFASRDQLSRVVLERMLAGLDAAVPPRAGAGRRAGRAAGAVDVEVGGLPHVRRAYQGGAAGPDGPPPG